MPSTFSSFWPRNPSVEKVKFGKDNHIDDENDLEDEE